MNQSPASLNLAFTCMLAAIVVAGAPHSDGQLQCNAKCQSLFLATELTLDADTILVLDSDPPAQDEFPEFLCH